NRSARAPGGDPGRPAGEPARAVPRRRRPLELRRGPADRRSREVGRWRSADRIPHDRLRWLLGDNHGNWKEHVNDIRGSVRPQHADELRVPCRRAGLAAAGTGGGVAPQRAPQETDRHRLLSSTADQDPRAREPASSTARDESGRASGGARARAKAETERLTRPRQAWETGPPTRSGGGLPRGGPASATAEGGKRRHPGAQGQVREPG